MKLICTAGLALLATFAVTGATRAADLPYGYEGKPDYSPYRDPRYGQIYGDPRHRSPPVARRYDQQRRHDAQREYYAAKPRTYQSYKDGPVYVEPRRHSERPLRYERYDYRCTPRRLIRRRLARQGWCNFSPVGMRPHVAIVDARRDGRAYRLRIDRCTGEVLHARALNHRQRRAYRRFGVTWQPGYRHAY